MFKATTEYYEWCEVPYDTQLRLVRALAKKVIDCNDVTSETIYLQAYNGQKFNINSILETVKTEIVTRQSGALGIDD